MANHMEPVKGLVGRVARRRLTQVEVEAGSRLPRLQQVLDWLPRCWSHINKFLETHSSSDVTIGKDFHSYMPGFLHCLLALAPQCKTLMSILSNIVCCHNKVSWWLYDKIFIIFFVLQGLASSCPALAHWKVHRFGSQTCGTTPWCPTLWRQSGKDFSSMEKDLLGRYVDYCLKKRMTSENYIGLLSLGTR